MYISYSKLREKIAEVRKEYEELYNSKDHHLKKTGFVGLRAINKVQKNIKDSMKQGGLLDG